MRFLGVTLKDTLVAQSSLTGVYGIGKNTAKVICNRFGLSSSLKFYQVTEESLSFIKKDIESNYLIGSDLNKKIDTDIEKLKKVNCYRGVRHRIGLPVRGQRTHTNAQTVRKLRTRVL